MDQENALILHLYDIGCEAPPPPPIIFSFFKASTKLHHASERIHCYGPQTFRPALVLKQLSRRCSALDRSNCWATMDVSALAVAWVLLGAVVSDSETVLSVCVLFCVLFFFSRGGGCATICLVVLRLTVAVSPY